MRVDDIELRVAPSGFTDEYGCFLVNFSLNANNNNLHRVLTVFAGVHGVNGLVLPAFSDVGGTGCFPVIYNRDLLVLLFVAPVRDSRSTNARSEELEASHDKDEALSNTTGHEPEFLTGTLFRATGYRGVTEETKTGLFSHGVTTAIGDLPFAAMDLRH